MMRRKITSLVFLIPLVMLLPLLGMAQQRNISGTVKGENQSPLQGATINVKNTNRVTQTDVNGHFSVQAATGEILVITYVGYEPQELNVNNSSVVAVTMNVSGSNMNEVVVTALGIKKERKALGYSVTDLSAQELMKNKNTNVINSLACKFPGVNITQFSS